MLPFLASYLCCILGLVYVALDRYLDIRIPTVYRKWNHGRHTLIAFLVIECFAFTAFAIMTIVSFSKCLTDTPQGAPSSISARNCYYAEMIAPASRWLTFAVYSVTSAALLILVGLLFYELRKLFANKNSTADQKRMVRCQFCTTIF